MRLLAGEEVAGFIAERQTHQIRGLKQASGVNLRIAIVRTNTDPVTDVYLRIKQRYAESIGVDIEVVTTTETEAIEQINALNKRNDVHGIIVQLPLADPAYTDQLLAAVDPSKDIDGLAPDSQYDPATPMAILWLLAAYNVELIGKNILIVGQGRLVGAPLSKMMRTCDYMVTTADETTTNLDDLCMAADVIITATGQPGLITSDMVKTDTVIVDAGTATDGNTIVGDVDKSVRDRQDIQITPPKGGVGPLTVAALFDNLIRAAENKK